MIGGLDSSVNPISNLLFWGKLNKKPQFSREIILSLNFSIFVINMTKDLNKRYFSFKNNEFSLVYCLVSIPIVG